MGTDADQADSDQQDDQTQASFRRLDIELGAAAVVGLLFVLLRLLAVARWDWPVVASIADTFDFSDVFAIAFGTIAAQPLVTGIFTAVLLPLALIRVLWPAPEQRGRIDISMLLFAVAMGVIAFAMTVTYRNPWTLVGAVGVGALVVTVKLFARTSRLRRLATVATEQIALIAVIGVLCLAVIDDVPWMDHEEITTTSDHGIIDGYVLETAPGFVHILTAHDRQVIILPADQVTGRTIVD